MGINLSWEDLQRLAPHVAEQVREDMRREHVEKTRNPSLEEPKPRRARGPNKLEQSFKEEWLDVHVDYKDAIYEGLSLPAIVCKSEDGRKSVTSYRPDWIVLTSDGRIQVYETKGYERAKDYQRFKAAAERFVGYIEFFYVRKKGKAWIVTRYGAP